MATPLDVPPTNDRELVLARLLDAPTWAVWRCWTEPALITQWFTPPPWRTVRAELDVRPGGQSLVVMCSPEGEEHPNPGVYLEVVPGRRLVMTDAFTAAWIPSDKAFMVTTLTMDDEGGRTRYIARAGHWSVEDRASHEEMGFHVGWGIATDQLEALAQRVAAGG